MINEIVNALKKDKLHEVVIRMSQLHAKDLEKLLKTFLINDYVKEYKKKTYEEILYEFELPDAYVLSFRLYPEDKVYHMAMEFHTTKSFYDSKKEFVIDSGFYEIKLIKLPVGWKNISNRKDKKVILELIKNF
jgi:hypothetical protein